MTSGWDEPQASSPKNVGGGWGYNSWMPALEITPQIPPVGPPPTRHEWVSFQEKILLTTLCVGIRVLVSQVLYADGGDLPAFLKRFLTKEDHIFTGAHIENDVKWLRDDFDITISNPIDLQLVVPKATPRYEYLGGPHPVFEVRRSSLEKIAKAYYAYLVSTSQTMITGKDKSKAMEEPHKKKKKKKQYREQRDMQRALAAAHAADVARHGGRARAFRIRDPDSQEGQSPPRRRSTHG
ncbi:hypothetical protein C2845_PM15G03820 [Panicum miliaceum]|uniref:Uncharacterized protein n=1 Tax=Panicum miliaceum TaxID=4540 RepID=A0A3L6QBY9_PANMI|nr:hypothetical protein C2845_PM15G03820 [Panicum miliaceum]